MMAISFDAYKEKIQKAYRSDVIKSNMQQMP
jgi:hypothetical protein